MTRFLIEGPSGPGGEPGPRYELTDLDYFLDEYAPKGFKIVADPPTGYDVPEIDAPKPQEMTRTDLNEFAAKAGVADPASFANKAALLAAVEQAHQPAQESEPEPTTTTTTAPGPESEKQG